MAEFKDFLTEYKPEAPEGDGRPDALGAAEPAQKPYSIQSNDTQSGDTWKAVKAGVQSGVVGPALAGARYLAERNGATNLTTIFKNLGVSSDETANENIEEMSPAAQKAMQAQLTSPEFWEHPGRAAYLKAANMTPAFAATVIPAFAMTGPVGATAMVAAANGTLSAGQAAQEIYKKVDETPDKDLQANVPFYAGLRELGLSEEDARTKYNQKIQGETPLVNFIVGAAVGAAGPAAAGARVLKGGAGVIGAAERGIAGRVGVGAAEGAAGNAVQGGTENATVQDALIDGGLQNNFDKPAFGHALVEQLAIGAVLGGGAGVISHGPTAKAPAERPTREAAPKVTVVETGAPNAAEGEALAASAGPAPVIPKAPEVQPHEVTPTAEVTPQGNPQATVPPQVAAASERVAAPDRPSAEPASDIAAQATDLADPQTPREAVWLPAATVDHLRSVGRLDEALSTGAPVADFDGQGGILIARDPKTRDAIVAARNQGMDIQKIIGAATGDGEGKPAGTNTVVQQRDPAGNVTRERLVAPEEAAPVQQQFAAPDKTVHVTNTEDALAQREAKVAAEAAPRAPRILQAMDADAITNREAQSAQAAGVEAELRKGTDTAPKGKNWTKKQLAKREADAAKAKELFDTEAPVDGTFPTSAEGRADLHDRVTSIVDKAEEAGINLKAVKAYDTTSDHMVWLREAYDLKRTLDKKGSPPARRDEHIVAFLGRERAAKGGDFEIMRKERAVEGDIAKRRNQGDVETMSGPAAKSEPAVMRADHELAGQETELSNATPEKDAIKSFLPVVASRKGVRGVDAPTETVEVKTTKGLPEKLKRAVAASKARKVELTPAERAKYETITPKVTPKIAEVQKRVAAAAKEVDPNPTQAQVLAGNAKKGHVSIQGLDIALENARGSVRSNKDPNGPKWSVTMPDHYGYIKRTKGADSRPGKPEQVDVYVGPHPDAKHVFLIDQHHLEGGKFDEHKAMVGYKDATNAMSAYERAFSDGKGFDRIGLIKPMTMDEFKAWLKHGDTEKPAAEIEDHKIRAHARDATEPVNFAHGGVNVDVKPLYSSTAKEVLKHMHVDHLDGVSAKLIPFLSGKMAKLVENTPVHIVSAEEMSKLPGLARSAQGLYVPDNVKGRKGDYILLNADELKTSADATHTLVHEVVHAVMAREIGTNPEYRSQIHSLMADVDAVLRTGDTPAFARYAFTDEYEFMSEAFSNPDFQQLLSETPLSAYAAERIGLTNKMNPSMWDYFMASIRKLLRGFGVPEGSFSALEGVLRVGKNIIGDVERKVLPDPMDPTNITPRALTREGVREGARDVRTNAGGKLRAVQDKLSSFIMLGQRAEHFLPGAQKVVELKSIMERDKHRILKEGGGQDLVRDLAVYEREHGTEAMGNMAEVGFEASNANVNLGPAAKNEHLGKDATKGWQAKARLPEMQKRFNALPAEGQALLLRTGEFFKKLQNDIALQDIKNILRVAGVNEPGLAERIHTDGLTEADIAKFKTNTVVNALNEARDIKQLDGMYIPFRRYGDHVVNSYYKVEAPAHGLKIAQDTVQFADLAKGSDGAARKQAQAYAEGHNLRHVDTKKVWVDKTDPTKIVEAEDVNAVPAYRVRLQRQSTEFFDNEALAKRSQAYLEGNKDTLGLEQVDGVRKRSDYVGQSANALSGQMHTVMSALEKQDRFKGMSHEERAAVRQTINEASVRVLGSTRLQSTFQQRRNVAGYSEDLGRVTADYARAATGYLAKLRHQPAIDDAFSALKEYTDKHKYESSDRTIRRDELINELRKRVYDDTPGNSQTTFGKAARRLLQISRLDKLAGVSFHVINSQEPWTTSLPVIGGRHGFIAATRALADAYSLIGARGGVLAGLKDTARAFTKDSGFTDYLAMFKHEIETSPAVGGTKASRLKSVLDYADNRGIFSDEAIYEVARYADPTQGALLRGLDRADLMANQVGNAIEKINRTVTLLSAYELEFKKTGNHEASMHYAYEVTHDTMGDYSGWNSPAAFKSNAGMLALQFKKFALKSYYLLGKTMQGTLKGDPEAAKQLVGLMVTHGVIAGALGLPGLEPIKVALLAANALGITGTTWGDVELAIRGKAVDVLGMKGGEVFSRGIYRSIGVEVSNRVGWDSLLTFGAPKDATKMQDLKAWLFDTMAGAPAGWMLDQIKSAQAISKGDFAKAVELSVPIRAFKDVWKAGEGQATKVDARGKPVRAPYSASDTLVRGLGFTPSSDAENYEKRAQFADATKEQNDAKSKLVNAWVSARGADKAAAFRAVQDWNRTQPVAVQIKPANLTSAASKRAKEGAPGTIVPTKQNAHILNKLNPVYGNPTR